MTISISYAWKLLYGPTLLDTITAGDQSAVAIAGLTNGTFLAAWTAPSNVSVQGGFFLPGLTPETAEASLNTTSPNQQFGASVAGLTNGNAVVTFTDFSVDPGGDIRGRLFNAAGTPLGSDFAIITATTDHSEPSVAALAGGGFVVSYTSDFGSGDHDVKANIFDASGGAVGSQLSVSSTSDALNSELSSVARTNAGFVAVWQEQPAAGGNTSVYFRRYDKAGTALDASPVLIDNSGSINADIHAVGLADGGFAVAYTDNGWNLNWTEITTRVFDSTGATRSDYIRVNTNTTGDQNRASITTLPDGGFAVGFLSASTEYIQAYDAAGVALGTNYRINSAIEGEITTLADGHIVIARSSGVSESAGQGNSIQASSYDLLRTTVSDSESDTLVGDALSDVFVPGGGNDVITGGLGYDTAQFAFALSAATVTRSGLQVSVASTTGTTKLTGVEHLTFTGGGVYEVSAHGDFNGDGTGDILLQNGGTVVDWTMKNGIYSSGDVLTSGAIGFSVVGKGDFNRDGTSDVVLQNGGTVVDWIMRDGHYQQGNLLTTGAAGYAVKAVGDVNGDGTADIVLQNGGTVVDWIMQDGKYQSGNVITNGATGYTVVGTGDFNGDGTADILLQNGGSVVEWIMKDGAYQSGKTITDYATGYKVVGTGDFNGDGTTDILLQNGGTVVDWIMKNGDYQSGNVITNGATGYTVRAVGDYNGDGTSDITLQSGGSVVDWIMQNGLYSTGHNITDGAAGYLVV